MLSNRFSSSDLFGLSLFGAIALHAIIILGVSFTIGDPSSIPPPDKTLDITIVQNPNRIKENDDPDFLAQTTQLGSGNSKEKAAPTTRQQDPVSVTGPQASRIASNDGVPEPEAFSAPEVLTAKEPEQTKRKNTQEMENQKITPPSMADLMATTQREIELLTAEIDTQTKMFAAEPRRKHLSASTREYAYANYLDAWRLKVEKIGNINYPEEAKRKNIHGSLMLTVAIKADGSIEKVQILRSSGKKVLDDAAIRIVKLASPYAPFPAEIRKKHDILDITRIWQFRDTNRLYAK